jgi:ribosomal protein S18 acetylase RimI-like enzyme
VNDLQVRAATVDDVSAIAAVHVQSWRETYAGLLPAAFLAGLSVDDRERRWRWLIGSGEVTVLVVVRGGEVVGWASAGDGRDVDAPRASELEGIYVLADAHGSGAGQLLLDAAVADAPAYLWVAEGNPRAEAFYRRNGFVRDGVTKHEAIGPDGLTAVRMVRG